MNLANQIMSSEPPFPDAKAPSARSETGNSGDENGWRVRINTGDKNNNDRIKNCLTQLFTLQFRQTSQSLLGFAAEFGR